MSLQETSEIARALEESRLEFNAAANGIPLSNATARLEAGRWSALDCVEHVAMVEERFFRWLEVAEHMETPRIDKQKEAELKQRVENRTERAEAPEPARPAGRFPSMAEALDHFNGARARTIRFAEERSGDLYSLAAQHPRFGPLNGTELLVIVAGHTRRHAEQIREIGAGLEKS